MKCNLCHLPFQDGKPVYHFPRGDGTPEQYHMSCFGETSQGRMGYLPKAVTIHKENGYDTDVQGNPLAGGYPPLLGVSQ